MRRIPDIPELFKRLLGHGKPLALAGPICAKCSEVIEDMGGMVEFNGKDFHFSCFLEIPTVERRVGERRMA